MSITTPQQQVCNNVAERGYLDDWNEHQAIARQICKAVEELGELCGALDFGHDWTWVKSAQLAGSLARVAFDDNARWGHVLVLEDIARAELPDVMVPLLTSAELLRFDVVEEAVTKSAADVARGVRV
jgi:hypothetical protein